MKKALTKAEFDAQEAVLRAEIVKAIELQAAESYIPAAPENTDVFDVPAVDSKTVAKLSPMIEEKVGHKLKPSWIKKGGYASAQAAAQHVIDMLREHHYQVDQSKVVPFIQKKAA